MGQCQCSQFKAKQSLIGARPLYINRTGEKDEHWQIPCASVAFKGQLKPDWGKAIVDNSFTIIIGARAQELATTYSQHGAAAIGEISVMMRPGND